jgi:hypothetical protein
VGKADVLPAERSDMAKQIIAFNLTPGAQFGQTKYRENYPSFIRFITGPSRTAISSEFWYWGPTAREF